MTALTGKVALVTGGSRGIGRAVVCRLAADGADVVFTFVANESAAREVVAEVGRDGGTARAVRADQGSAADLAAAFDSAEEWFGGLDIMVCNAADSTPCAIPDVTEDEYDRVMAVNAKGPFFAIQRAGRLLRDGGRIITVSTVNTVLHEPGGALYIASKGALEHFTIVAAQEFGARGITANIVSPGATDTDLLRTANPGETFDEEIAATPLGRLGRPADIAGVVAFLAGPDAAWVTGQNLRATGGSGL